MKLQKQVEAEAKAEIKDNQDNTEAIDERVRATRELIDLNDEILKQGEEEIELSLEQDRIDQLRLNNQKEGSKKIIKFNFNTRVKE